MKVIGWFFLIIFGLIAVLAAGLSLMMYKGGIEREKRIAGIRQENLEYKEKIERLCVFPSGYAPTVSGKIFNLTQYNLALKDTIFDIKKDVVYEASHYLDIDNEYRQAFPELRKNGIRYEVIDNKCYVSDFILPLTFEHQSQKISVGGLDWDSDRYNGVQHNSREDFFAYVCLRKLCKGEPPVYVPLTKGSDVNSMNSQPDREFFEDKRFPDVIFYADFESTTKHPSGEEYSKYDVRVQHKFLKKPNGSNYGIHLHVKDILGSQGKPPVFTTPAFLEGLKPNRPLYINRVIEEDQSVYFNGGSIHPESFSTNVLPIMTEFMQAVQAYPQQFISDQEPQ